MGNKLAELKQTRYEQVVRPEASENEQKLVKKVVMSSDNQESNVKNLQKVIMSRQLAEVANHEKDFNQQMEIAANVAQIKVLI